MQQRATEDKDGWIIRFWGPPARRRIHTRFQAKRTHLAHGGRLVYARFTPRTQCLTIAFFIFISATSLAAQFRAHHNLHSSSPPQPRNHHHHPSRHTITQPAASMAATTRAPCSRRTAQRRTRPHTQPEAAAAVERTQRHRQPLPSSSSRRRRRSRRSRSHRCRLWPQRRRPAFRTDWSANR